MKRIVKDIFRVLDHKERSRLLQLIFLDVLVSILDIAFLAMLLYVVDFYTGGRSVQLDYFPFTEFNRQPLLLITTFLLGFSGKNLLAFRVFRMQHRFVYAVASRLSNNNMIHYLRGSFGDFVNINSAVHTRRISHQPIEFGHYVLAGFQQVVGQSILILITIIAILIYNPVLFPLLFIVLTPPIVLTGILVKRKLNSIRASAKPVSEKTIQHLREALSGYVESNLYGSNEYFTKRYVASQARFNNFLADQLVVQHLPYRLIEIFAIFGLFVLVLINSYGGSATVDVITIGAFMAAAYKIIPGIVKILNNSGQMKTYGFTMKDLLAPQVTTIDQTSETVALKRISFDKVGFDHKDKKILKNFSCSIAAGELTGIAGVSGRGKTSIINLLLGFEEQGSGGIFMNDRISTAAERQGYWKNIAYVKQEPFLIDDSIRTNITLSEKTDNPQRLSTAVAATGLDAVLSAYPEGIEKAVAENGKNISGGQRQRIAIARALYKNADCIILDEPFNELDEPSEKRLLDTCKKLAAEGKMVLLITHNRESLSSCDKIIELDEK